MAAAGLLLFPLGMAQAQDLSPFPVEQVVRPDPNAQMLLESDELVYDYDQHTVAAVGNVKIYYSGYTLEAGRVTYFQVTHRLIAEEGVRLIEPNGTVLTAVVVDITDDFRDGFVQSLRIATVERTYFAAQQAERVDGERTVFTDGVYTACEPCRDNPEKPPLWQVRAGRIIVDHKEKMVYFENASFEFAGVPLAWAPYFWTPDPTVKRKSGFLTPTFSHESTLGFSVAQPYYWALAPSYDMTFTPHYYTRQGFLGEVEWRQRFLHGEYTIRGAGINQNDPSAFIEGKAGTFAQTDWRGGVRSNGKFEFGDIWTFGWDGTLLSDRTFSRNYGVLDADGTQLTSQAYLTGIDDRNFFDVRSQYFHVLVDDPASRYSQTHQAVIHPVMDHFHIYENVLGGELTLGANLTSLTRPDTDALDLDGDGTVDYYAPSGTNTRTTVEAEWQRTFVAPGGHVLTPFAFARGDAQWLDSLAPTTTPTTLTSDSSVFRGMVGVGFEWRWPLMIASPHATQVFEPIAQFILRPDATYAGSLPNEDAQSLVFDDTNLFSLDKFSGYDRIEGGSRVNFGLRYQARFASGGSIDAVVGQSIHLAGTNPFAVPDLTGTSTYSGLESDVSDIVGRITYDTGQGHRYTARGRFDQQSFALNRGELEVAGLIGPLSATSSLIYLQDSSSDDGKNPIFVARGGASARLNEYWRLYGSIDVDIDHQSIASTGLGLAYDDSCLSVSLAYSNTRDAYDDVASSHTVLLRIQLRTLGETTVSPYSASTFQ